MSAQPTFQKERQHAAFRFVSRRLGPFLDRHGIQLPMTDLREDRLYRGAERTTWLKDYGGDAFREPFHVLLEAAKNEGHLNWNGRRAVHAIMTMGLQTRLWTAESIRRNPAILEQPVRAPLIVVGAPRTATTLMNQLLSLDPVARPIYMWESFSPTPWFYRRKAWGDPRPLMTSAFIRLSKLLVPELGVVHDFDPNLPDECQYLFWPTFVWPVGLILPSYRAWLKAQPESVYDAMYGEYRRALQMLHWQRPAQGHWVLKSPLHAWALPSLMKMLPEACVIQTHRHLRQVMPSVCSLASVLLNLYTDDIEPRKMGPAAIDLARDAIDRIMANRDRIDPARHCDVDYSTFVANPVETIRGIYRRFGRAFTPAFEERMRAYLGRQKSAGRVRHVYSLDQFGLDGEAIDREFATYHRHFGLVN